MTMFLSFYDKKVFMTVYLLFISFLFLSMPARASALRYDDADDDAFYDDFRFFAALRDAAMTPRAMTKSARAPRARRAMRRRRCARDDARKKRADA